MASKKSILLVEDNPDDQALVLHALRNTQIADEVTVVRDGAEALDYLAGIGSYAGRDLREMPQLMLVDLHLPNANGFEVLRKIRSEAATRLLPAVVLTSSAEQADVMQSYRLGANSYIRKPVDFTELVDVIRQIAGYWLLLNESPSR